jgi:hypothetical protein
MDKRCSSPGCNNRVYAHDKCAVCRGTLKQPTRRTFVRCAELGCNSAARYGAYCIAHAGLPVLRRFEKAG